VRTLTATWSAVRTVDVDAVTFWRPLRIGALVALLLAASMGTGNQAYGPSLVVGAIMVGGMLDGTTAGSYRRRRAALVAGAVALTLATLVGGAIADHPVLHVAVMAALALVCGTAAFAGPTATLVGVLVLVVASVYSGAPDVLPGAVRQAGAFLVGAAASIVVVTAAWPWRRADGSRAALALVLRGMGRACRKGPGAVTRVVHAERLRAADADLVLDSHHPPAAGWFQGLVALISGARFGLIGLTDVVGGLAPGPGREAGTALVDACGAACRALGRALVWPTTRRSLARHDAELEAARTGCTPWADVLPVGVVDAALTPLHDALAVLGGSWAVGPGTGVRLPGRPHLPAIGLRSHLSWADPSFRHGVRLALAMAAGVVVSERWHISHAYWIPMTVAWVSKPGLGDTAVRVLARLTGTAVGVAVALALDLAVHPSGALSVALISIAGVLTLAFITPNYAIAIAAWSVFVVFVLATVGEAVTGTGPDRILCTAVGGAMVLAAGSLWPVRRSGTVCGTLVDTVGAVRRYRASVVEGTDAVPEVRARTRDDLLAARSRAATAVDASAHEPGRSPLRPEDARAVLDALDTVMAHVVSEELGAGPVDGDSAGGCTDDELASLAERLGALERDGRCPRSRSSASPSDPLAHADRVLDRYA